MAEAKTILCVEDDPDSCQLIKYLLESEGYEVKTCQTSEEALQTVKQDKFSAIILDYYLPGISGVEICRQIRTYDQETPIIFYSAAAFPKDKQKALAAGAQAYLVKPNDFEKITEIVARLTSRKLFNSSSVSFH